MESIEVKSKKLTWYYNVSYAVGVGGINRSDDVMLVQYLLKKVFENAKYGPAKPTSNMNVDGFYGPITASYIRAYQRRDQTVNPSASVVMDGRIDKAVSSDGLSGDISDRVYCIAALNLSLQQDHPSIFADPSTATDMPGALKMRMIPIALAHEISFD